ncbi:F-box/FBD/LRR-repeat protein At1g13570 isoform X2 [Manihot esculenta]|uniref:Uncharacterized protein n=1 Tax=Manihot esculenta TaxID=3983 RepID=A0A251JXB6_MANES|nr:F-box/FBD/LRR-repeat protein At1g13570 isoform X2 [Manihot esculenta]
MRDAVKTGLLSRRWRFLFSFTPQLKFDTLSVFGKNPDLQNKSKFLMAVNQFLRCYTGPKIDTFQLTYRLGDESASHIDGWINFASQSEAKTIFLNFDLVFVPGIKHYDFPCHLLIYHAKTSSLKHLHLVSCTFTPSLDHAKRLISLRTLYIGYVPLSPCHLDTIMSTCLNLECLTLNSCYLPGSLRIFGPSSGLESFKISCNDFLNLELNSLKKLNFFEFAGIAEALTFTGLPTLRKAYFMFLNKYISGARYMYKKLAKDLPQLEILSVVLYPFEGLPVSDSASPLRNVKELLHFSTCDQFNRAKVGSKQPHLQLKELEISGCIGRSCEMEFFTYLLDNCVALKVMTVRGDRKKYLGDGRWMNDGIPRVGSKLNLEVLRDMLLQQRVNSCIEIIHTNMLVMKLE